MRDNNYNGEVKLAAGQFTKEEDYWLNQLSGDLVVSRLPYDKKYVRECLLDGLEFKFPSRLSASLLRISGESDPKLFMILVAGLVVGGITQAIGGTPLQAGLETGRVEIQHIGRNTYHLTMEDRGNGISQVRVRLNSEGQVLEKTLRTAD